MKENNKISPTLLDFTILGLIQEQALSGYRIRKTFEDTALGNFGTSPGTIYPALKRLTKFELVEKIPVADTTKFQFLITKKGLQTLKVWLSTLPEKKDVERGVNMLILKFAFMDSLLNKEQKLEFLKSFRDLLISYSLDLQNYHKKESLKMPLNAKLAFEHGIESYKSTLKWCKKVIIEISALP